MNENFMQIEKIWGMDGPLHFLLLAEEQYFFEVAEAVFVSWFSFEYVVRCVDYLMISSG